MASPQQEPKPGDLIEIFRLGYEHWALYIGDDYVIHLAPPVRMPLIADGYPAASSSSAFSVAGGIAVVKQELLKDVLEGCKYRVNNSLDRRFEPLPVGVIISSAKELVGQKMKYSIVSRNCEHFVTKLRYGRSHCQQVENAVADVGAFAIIGAAVAGCSFAIMKYQK
ncbi:PREDICTED: retinoic acid receptor responder protein 3 isoform X3 [Cercocebus atys]|uniref:retinoic acid receptor responder protein 3 isoform X3 n=1 Tax=Cercocebus atys TaxID=9531 RepID=UPI0005F451C2|nr:PREDICTED: retinoic acid receptor responder protein 3 isoform X3 [Cercocebus atys]XP_011897399.1 PREDICTED: retinoic acid receptor responder protein 3 isoform X3 [Cercocebus atys]XP_011897400.1 PREDICTED: retinoic acid receptor responder protein 3 isoform X3 [Cercocebus atys]